MPIFGGETSCHRAPPHRSRSCDLLSEQGRSAAMPLSCSFAVCSSCRRLLRSRPAGRLPSDIASRLCFIASNASDAASNALRSIPWVSWALNLSVSLRSFSRKPRACLVTKTRLTRRSTGSACRSTKPERLQTIDQRSHADLADVEFIGELGLRKSVFPRDECKHPPLRPRDAERREGAVEHHPAQPGNVVDEIT